MPVAFADADASRSGSGCPVDHENMSKEEIAAFMSQKRFATSDAKPASPCAGSSPAESVPSASGGCPVDHKNMSKEEIAEYIANHKHPFASGEAKDAKTSKKVYDVYGQEIDPSNMMPATPNQLPSPGQAERLPTERVSSSIPKSEVEGNATWTYPSPQMFYNALKRKGKADDVEESDMESVVAIHNNMNEKTWAEVLEWEKKYHCATCDNPKLRKFQGRPHDLSPAARFRMTFMGYPKPFDRHDWVVDRCGKQDARYVIDYYYREHPSASEGPIELHVRPAADSFGAVWDRFRDSANTLKQSILGSSTQEVHGLGGPAADHVGLNGSLSEAPIPDVPVTDAEFKFLSNLTPEKIETISNDVRKDCARIGLALAKSKEDPEAYERANVSLNYCMASKICKPQSDAFKSAMELGSGSESTAYSEMASCLDRFHVMARRVMTLASGVPQTGPEKQ